MTRRRLLIGVGVLVVALVVGIVVALTAGGGKIKPVQAIPLVPAAQGPEAQARAACQQLAELQRLVQEDASTDAVYAQLTAATGNLDAALQSSPRWRPLDSAVHQLRQGLDANSAQVTEQGIAVARDQCRQVDVPIPVPTSS